MSKSKFSAEKVALTGLMAALVFASNLITIKIPLGADITRIHLGNACMLFAAMLLGGPLGGTAAGLGSMLYDLTDASFVSSAPFTLVFRFLMGFTCGSIAHFGGREGKNAKFNIIGAIAGSALYVMLYLGKTFIVKHYIEGMTLDASMVLVMQKSIASIFNAVVGVVISVPLATAARRLIPRLFNRPSHS